MTHTKLGVSPSQLRWLGACQFQLRQWHRLNGSACDTCHKVLNVCSFQQDGWARAAARGRMTFCVVWGGNLLWLPSSCLLRLSALVSSEHIKTQTNKPCHFEAPALVTSLLSGMSSGIWSHSPVGGCEVYKHMQEGTLSLFFSHTHKRLRNWNASLS